MNFERFAWNDFASVSLAQERLAVLLQGTDLDMKTRRSVARVMIYSLDGRVNAQLNTLEWKREESGAILYRVVKGKPLMEVL